LVKILVIDDDAGMRRTTSRILRDAGHEVTEAADGQEGMNSVRTNRPDIVVTDIFMPKKEGFETIQELRQEHPSTLILVVSGGTTLNKASPEAPDYLNLMQGLGADGTLAKPFRAKDLLLEIDKLLRKQVPGV
jgi:DNA-binding response OmpR family regulator